MHLPPSVQLGLAWLRYGAERLGWPGMLGLALGGAALATWLIAIAPLDAGNAARRDKLATLRASLAMQPESIPAAEARVVAGLPGGNALLPLVAAVHAGARAQNVALEQGEYVWQRGTGDGPARYRMIFPARGSYAGLRGWTATLLAARSELVLEEFDLRRENIGSATVEARVQFSVRLEGAA